MKKENRRMAQQARAEERRKQERNRKIKKFLSYFIPLAVILILIGILAADSLSNSQSTATDGSASTETETDSTESSDTEDTSESQTSYSTDTSLTVEDGDTVNIDYIGTVDGVEFDGGNTNGQGTDLVIGSGSYIDDFEEQLIGAHPGNDVQVEVTFPDDYSNADLQGKDAVFAVTINGIYE